MIVDLSIYDKDIIISVLHRLSYIFTAKLETKDNETAEIVVLNIIESFDSKGLEELIFKELNDQFLRVKINKETESMRNLILAHAFSKTKFVIESE